MSFLGRAHMLGFAAIVGAFRYLAIRATTLGDSWTPALSIPLVVAGGE